ncbi:MAG: sulfotransferase domain-containing protein [Gemmatimonadales bacterium]
MTALEAVKRPLRRLRTEYRELTGPLRGLPSALIIGAQKGGTTFLFDHLVQHPDVLPPLNKEIHYFDLNYTRGVTWYRARFPYSYQLRGRAVTIDASPYYLVHPQVPQRVPQLLPGAKLIVLLRNPVDRAFSHYQHEFRAGRESLSFPEAIERESDRLAGEEARLRLEPAYYSYNHHRYSYMLRGVYIEQLRRWARHFHRSQFLVLQSECLFRDPAAGMVAVHGFLGLRAQRLERYAPSYQGNYQRGMSPDLRARLVSYFEPYNRELFQWLGEEFDWT